MTIEYSVELGIGYAITPGTLQDAFGRVLQAQTHTEARYDERAGAPRDPVEITNVPERTVLFLPGDPTPYALTDWEQRQQFLDARCDRLDARYTKQDTSGSDEIDRVLIMPQFDTEATRFHAGHLSVGGGIDYHDAAAVTDELTRIATHLRHLGLTPEPPMIRPVVHVG